MYISQARASYHLVVCTAACLCLSLLPGCDDPGALEHHERDDSAGDELTPEELTAEQAEEFAVDPEDPEDTEDIEPLDDLAAPLDPAEKGSSVQKNNGLTCKNEWFNTLGRTKCTGAGGVKWRLHVRCKWQADYKGSWQYGPGSDAFECNFGVQSAGIIWG